MKEKATLRVAVVTGATSGIGFELALQLARAGWRVIGLGRSSRRSRLASELIRAQTGNPHVHYLTADFLVMKEVAAAARQIAQEQPRIDLLINNAGSLFSSRQETVEGLERTFALNHLAPALFVHTLMPALTQAHILNISSVAHIGAVLDSDDLELKRGRFGGWKQYQRSKLMTVLYTRALARRLPAGARTNAVHPGFVRTRFGSDNPRWWRVIMSIMMVLAIKPQKAAREVLAVALDPQATGLYFDRGRLAAPSAVAQDDALGEKLWHKTEEYIQRFSHGAQT